jgi:hypothetical protein
VDRRRRRPLLRWNGTHWRQVPSGTPYWLTDVAFSAADAGWAIGDNGTILRWNGGAWQAVASRRRACCSGSISQPGGRLGGRRSRRARALGRQQLDARDSRRQPHCIPLRSPTPPLAGRSAGSTILQ